MRTRLRSTITRAMLATLAGGALALPAGLAGQTPTRTVLPPDGLPLSSTISAAGEVDDYALTIARAGTYDIAARGGTGLTLILLGPDGLTAIETDPDAGAGSAPVISRALAAGAYVVRVTGPTAGPYSVSAGLDASPPAPLAIDGPSLTARIGTPQEVDEFTLTIAERGVYAVGTTGDQDLTATIAVAGRNQAIAASDDDGPGLNPLLVATLAPGRYLVRVRHLALDGTGAYRVAARTVPQVAPVALAPGRTVNAAITAPEDVDRYRLRITRAGRYRIVSSGRIDVAATLRDARGRILAEDDDGGPGLNLLLDARLRPGTYTVTVTLVDGRLGRYGLSARLVPPPTAVPLRVGAPTLRARFSQPREEDDYRLAITAPGVYEIATSGDTDTVLRLLRSDRTTVIASADDQSDENLNALIRRRLAPGVYFVRATNFAAEQTGPYGILVVRAS